MAHHGLTKIPSRRDWRDLKRWSIFRYLELFEKPGRDHSVLLGRPNPPIRHYLSMTLPTNMYKNGMNMSRWSKYSIDVCLVQQLWYVLMNISRWTKSVVFVCCCGIPWEVLESFCIHGDLDLIWIWDRDLSSQDCQDNPKHHWVLSVFLSSFYMFFIIIFNCTVYRR